MYTYSNYQLFFWCKHKTHIHTPTHVCAMKRTVLFELFCTITHHADAIRLRVWGFARAMSGSTSFLPHCVCAQRSLLRHFTDTHLVLANRLEMRKIPIKSRYEETRFKASQLLCFYRNIDEHRQSLHLNAALTQSSDRISDKSHHLAPQTRVLFIISFLVCTQNGPKQN